MKRMYKSRSWWAWLACPPRSADKFLPWVACPPRSADMFLRPNQIGARLLVIIAIAVSLALAGGCVNALRDGYTEGLRNGVAATVESAFAALLGGLIPSP